MSHYHVLVNVIEAKRPIREYLSEPGEIYNMIVARLDDTLKANLSACLPGEPETRLTALIADMEPPDFAVARDMTLREFASHALRESVGQEEALQEEYERFLRNLPDNRDINDILQLDQPLVEHPLFTDLVLEARLQGVLALTPLREQADRINQFQEVLDRCGGLHAGFWKVLAEEGVASREEIEYIKLSFDLTALALGNVELAGVLKASGISSIRDLIPLHREDWLTLLKENRITPPDSCEGEKPLETYAAHLESSVAEAYPTEMFFNRLLTQEIETFQGDLALVKPFLQVNPGIALEQEISYRKVHWHTEDRGERTRVKKSAQNLRRDLKLYSQLGLAQIVNDPHRKPEAKINAIQGEIAKLETFLQNNPNFDLHYADFHQGYATLATPAEEAACLNWDGLEEADQEKIQKQLMVYQRLFRIHPHFKTAQVLLENDLDSAHKIILMTEEQFVEQYAERLSNPSPDIPQAIYGKALGIAENTIHQWANVKDMIVATAWRKQLSNNTTNELQQYYQSFQSYQDMFGSLNFYECEDCQSIFGPAAYFVDLMRFIDLYITQGKNNQIPVDFALEKRRPDLWRIPLDCENTNTLISYLDVVNEILENHVKKAANKEPYVALNETVHPLNLPFNLPLAEMRIYLSHFKKTLAEIYEAFGVPEAAVACEYLGLSQVDQTVLRSFTLGPNDLANIYGIDSQKLYSDTADGLARVKTFLQHTGLTRTELEKLLYQDLSQGEKSNNVQASFFINVNDGHGPLAVVIDTEIQAGNKKVQFERITDSSATHFSQRKLNFIHRFIRLARKLGWSFADLDWVLWSLGNGTYPANIDDNSLMKIAKIKKWCDKYALPLDILCSFWSNVKNIGKGNTPESAPLDLFDRLFNHPDILKGQVPYDLSNPVTWHLDQATDMNRNRLLAAFGVSDEDLNRISRQMTAANTLELNHENLSRLYRFGKIPKVLNLSVQEFIELLNLMREEGLLGQVEIIRLEDFEKLIKVVDWLKASGLSVYELSYLLTSNVNPFVEAGYSDVEIRLLTEELSREFKNALMGSAAFLAIEGLNEQQAKDVYDQLKADGFLVDAGDGARLTEKFTPEDQNFTLGLLPALIPPGKDPAKFEKQIIEILQQHDEKKIALKRLAVFFGVEPDMLKSVIKLAVQKLEDAALLALLATPLKEDQAIPKQMADFLRPIHARLFLARKLELSRFEIDCTVAHPDYYGINDLKTLKIADVEALHTFKRFTQDFNDASDALIGYFGQGTRDKKIERLASLTRWDEKEVALLFDRFWPSPKTDYSNVAGIRKLKQCFDISLYMGVGIKPLLEWVKTVNGIWADYTAAANSALEILKAKYSEAEWKKKYEPLADKIRTLKRDALAAYAIWNIDKQWSTSVPRIENLRDLYAYLLIDVEMTSCAKTSRIAQGIATIQLFIQRCQMNLEPNVTPESVPVKQWEWMKNYRVWEANRKVFLYPENYIEPELRDNKSPIFKELEDELLQGEVTDENVEKAYRNYLNKFAELANLKIAGSYHDTGTDTLYLFGRTNTQPYTYYYRTYKKQTTWTAWEKVNLSIKSEYVSPVLAFNRLFVFWVELSTTKESKIASGNSQDPVEKYQATIKYSFHDFNRNWIQPQTLIQVEDYEYNTIHKPKDLYWNQVFPVSIQLTENDLAGEHLYLTYGGISYLGGTSYFPVACIGMYSSIELANRLVGVQPPFGSLGSGFRDIYMLSSWSQTSKKWLLPVKLHVFMVFSEIEFPLQVNYPIKDRPHDSEVYKELDPLLGQVSTEAAVKAVNNSSLPTWYVFDNGDEEFLVGTPFALTGVLFENSPIPLGHLFSFKRISTYVVHELSNRLFTNGLKKLLSVGSQVQSEPSFSRLQPINVYPYTQPYSEQHVDFEGAYGLYYWEVFFHTPFLVADRLNADQQFEEAQKWYHYIFNPTIQQPEKDEVLKDPKDIIWRFLPFRELTLPKLQDMLTNTAALKEYHENPFKPHVIASLRPTAYEKAIVMKYIDNLLDWGDYLFAQNTSEAINEATLLYVLAYNLLGPRPEKLGAYKSQPLTFDDIKRKYQKGSLIPEFLIELENSTLAAGAGNGVLSLNNDFCFYFCIPENGQLLSYWDRAEKSLYKIRHCMNIKGVVQELALFAPPIPPMALVQAAAAGRDIASVLTEVLRPVPPYRFSFMLEKAKSLCTTVQQLGSALLSALEKKDAEELALLRSMHEKNILQLTTTVREKQRDEAVESHAALLEGKASATTRNKHYKDLIDKGLSHHEQTHLASMIIAWGLEQEANILSTMASIVYAVPQSGSPFAMTYGGRELGAVLTAVSQAFRTFASFYTLSGSMSSTLGSYERRTQDWSLQEQLSQHDIDQIEKQIAAAELRKQIAEQELKIHEKNIEQTDKIYDFIKDKFSSKDLYQWMANQLSGLYFQTYKLAYDLAKSAEKAYQYERDTDEAFINFGHWDSLKKGLLAGERLMLELNQLEKAYLDDNTRPFEIEKTISLAHIDPLALIELKQEGSCEFHLTEELFDYDFPGHYCRKIKTIAISIPAIAGPYENIKATLTQQRHRTLLQPDPNAFSKNSVELDANSDSVRSDWIKNQQIAISRGVNDSGMFELNFRDERYLPFEGTGAVSDWKLEMPKATNRIDFDSISDVIIHLKYTARYDGTLRTNIQEWLTEVNGYRILSLKHEFSTAWHRFMNPETGKTEQELIFNISEELFPPNAKNYKIESLYCKIDLASGLLPLGTDLNLSMQPAKANLLSLKFNQSDITGEKMLAGGSPFGDWVIKMTREDIPAKLRRRKDGADEVEVIAGKNHYYLDPEQVKNIGVLLLYESAIVWPGQGN